MLKLFSRRKKNDDSELVAIPIGEQEPIISEGVEKFRISGDTFMFKDRTKWLLLANTVLPTDTAFQELAAMYKINAHEFYDWIIQKRTKTRMLKPEIAAALSNRLLDESEKIADHVKQEIIGIKRFIQEQGQAINDIISFKMKLEKLCETQTQLRDMIELLNFTKIDTSKAHTFRLDGLDCVLEHDGRKRILRRNIKKGFNENPVAVYTYRTEENVFGKEKRNRYQKHAYTLQQGKETKVDLKGFEFTIDDSSIVITMDTQTLLQTNHVQDSRGERGTVYGKRQRPDILSYGSNGYSMFLQPKKTGDHTVIFQKYIKHYQLQQHRGCNHQQAEQLYDEAKNDYIGFILYKLICDSLKVASIKEIADMRFHNSDDKIIPTLTSGLLKILGK